MLGKNTVHILHFWNKYSTQRPKLGSLTIRYTNNVSEIHFLFYFSYKNPLTLLAEPVQTGPMGQLAAGRVGGLAGSG
jgi:hypothetical protein